jgi:hypothetical protein
MINADISANVITNAPMIFQVSSSRFAHGEAVNPSVPGARVFGAVHVAQQAVFAGVEPSGRTADNKDFSERSALDVVAGGAVES